MAELNFKKLADAPVLEEVPDGAKVYAEVDGKVYRVAGDNLGGGGIPAAIIRADTGSAERKSLMTLAAGDGARSSSSQGYPCTVENMTFEEAKAILTAGKPLDIAIIIINDGMTGYFKAGSVAYTPDINQMVESNPTEPEEGIMAAFIMFNSDATIIWTASTCTFYS